MTEVLDAPVEASALPEATEADGRRPSTWTRWRVAVRLAWRQSWRTKGSSALVVLLVALPVAGLAGIGAFWQAHEPSPEQRVRLELGENESWIEVTGGPDPSRRQAVDQPYNTLIDTDSSGEPTHPQRPAPTVPPALVPDGATVVSVQQAGSMAVGTDDGVAWLNTIIGEPWARSLAGVYVQIEGTAPSRGDEFMATPGALARIGAEIGDEVHFPDAGVTLTLTGTMRAINAEESSITLFLPSPQRAADTAGPLRWYVADWQPTVEELGELNRAGYISYARDLVLDPPAGARRSEWSDGSITLWNVMLVGLIAAAISGYVVVLLAGAAFSVASRRQQRALAVAASVGAARTDVFRVVVLQGTALGLVGGIAGSFIGLLGAAVALIATDRGVVGTFWGNFGFAIPWVLVVPIVLFAVLVGTLAAIAPARAATRGDTLAALRGARRPALLRPRRPVWGLVVMGVGLLALIAGGLFVAATLATEGDTASPLFVIAVCAVVFGPILFQIGVLIPSHWVLVQLSKVASRFGLAPRLASRDAAANPSRVVPAFAVIGACIFAASFVLSITAMTAASNARQHFYQAPLGALTVQFWQLGSDDSEELLATADDLLAPTAPSATALVETGSWPQTDDTGAPLEPEAKTFAVARQSYDWCGTACELAPYDLAAGMLSVVDPDEVATLLDVPRDPEAVEMLRRGGAIVTDPGYLTPSGDIIVTEWSQSEYQGLMSMTDASAADATEHPLPALALDLGHPQRFDVIIAPETAAGLGVDLVPSALVATYDERLPASTIDRLTAQTMDLRVSAEAGLSVTVESGPAPSDPWLWLITGVAIALVVGAAAVSLGLARFERLPDDATLTAVGGSRLLRRNVNAWQAAIIVGFGAVVGTTTGALSVWAFAKANPQSYRLSDTPWPWLTLLALGLPVAIALVAWLVPPRRPDLTRRTAIT